MSAEWLGLIGGALFGAWVLVVGVCRVKRENDQMLRFYAELLEKAVQTFRRTGSIVDESGDGVPGASGSVERASAGDG